jgi:hypothetical protein
MNRVLHRISRSPYHAPDRRWVAALLAELATIQGRRARMLWLLGATGMLFGHYTRSLAALLTPVSLVCAAAALLFGVLAITEYEGLAVEDDWYPLIAAAAAAALICVSVFNLRRRDQVLRP